ncbi:mechanosensitive ion channel family protein [Microbulbifer yueqingensis]|uniref:Small conductance mechanosensitive channel n=1 Tax=Microbulbifer yueqingensis TaxID=658219 RepID=A0A1G8XU45_9GAMM|nr:mechanosensitive ion channel family protein [Microbulbifer yueqingensis]SDJ94152.1 small conductance mechanosensitive channel [Microbulbifer yueqingensis]
MLLLLSAPAAVAQESDGSSQGTGAAAIPVAQASPGAGAPEKPPHASGQARTDSELSPDQLDRLVGLLEDPARRNLFLKDLKRLRQATDATAGDGALKISNALSVDDVATEIVRDYSSFLNGIGLSANEAGRLLLLAIAAVILLVAVAINNRLAGFVDGKLRPVRKRAGVGRSRFSIIFGIQRWLGYVMALILFGYTGVELFGEMLGELLSKDALRGAARVSLSLFLIVAVFCALWETINGVVEHYFGERMLSANARVRTLVPLIRNLLLFTLTVMTVLVVLSELDIDVMPLLAGAGVFGIAIGFGAQTLVKDFLTGFTILLEDLLQVGDIVTVGGRTGEVTHITLRKIELRALDGTVHTIPFSEISVVDNLTKNYSYYMLEIGVAYRENTDEVISCLHAVDEEMRQSEDFGSLILAPLEVLGVDAFADSAVVIKARTKTRAHEKWRVGREFNRRIKLKFDREGIEIPFPHQTLYFGEDKSGQAPPARVALHKQNSAEEATGDADRADKADRAYKPDSAEAIEDS